MARHPALVNIRILTLLALPALAGCAYLPPMPERPRDVFTTPIVNRGHPVTEDQIAQITTGVSTRADVQALLGSPSQTSTFSDNSWYYISGVTQLRPARSMALRSQRVVAIDFNPAGTVAEIRQLDFTQGDMPRVNFVERETPSPGNERTLMQALFGNVGRIGPNPSGNAGILPAGGPVAGGGR
ncbi:outer membrane protein assembly factor BamE [Sediminicoccus rosea]|jgi:outer membrane protein assembly factor BamE (lipoprotein component of BamABCDE complex)|uniref:Outer membrane protein assembly factor BamE n=1 Tax=Sediminicoccus rosea TaxID=1225128 RepID=A0ABZ0PH11_9PROT|nr:outer membrane protein assembly factor BamE [Sediminicoccus rosea]WPB84761.1 outer membrane protein assembly factor BamE [Sediminicoccus rosea]